MFQANDPSSLSAILQLNNRPFYELMKILGFKTVVDSCFPIKKAEVKKYNPDPNGNYIERNLAEIESHKSDPDHVFNPKRGRMHMVATLFDLFLAGRII